jgi:gliotoxin/aspirochlorine biosynthesis gamma-glutamylcyclotransferase
MNETYTAGNRATTAVIPDSASPSSSLNRDELDIWYFAYGANMSASVLTGQRKIQPRLHVSALLPRYELSFDVLGLPYSEPALAGLRLRDSSSSREGDSDGEETLPVHGVAYLISAADFHRIVATEGAGVAYKTLLTRAVVIPNPSGLDTGTGVGAGIGAMGGDVAVWTLVTRRPAHPVRRPSARYLVSRKRPPAPKQNHPRQVLRNRL